MVLPAFFQSFLKKERYYDQTNGKGFRFSWEKSLDAC